MKVELTADGKPHTIVVPDELEPWDGQRDLWNALPWVIGWLFIVLVAVVVAFWVTHE